MGHFAAHPPRRTQTQHKGMGRKKRSEPLLAGLVAQDRVALARGHMDRGAVEGDGNHARQLRQSVLDGPDVPVAWLQLEGVSSGIFQIDDRARGLAGGAGHDWKHHGVSAGLVRP